jgi:hypothetical protein
MGISYCPLLLLIAALNILQHFHRKILVRYSSRPPLVKALFTLPSSEFSVLTPRSLHRSRGDGRVTSEAVYGYTGIIERPLCLTVKALLRKGSNKWSDG